MFTSKVETDFTPPGGAVSTQFYEVAGRTVEVESDADWAARFAASFLSGFHLEPGAVRGGRAADLRLSLLTREPPPLPPGLEVFEIPGGVCHSDSRHYFVEVCGSRVAVGAADEREVTVWLGGTPGARRRGSLISVLAYALPAALRRCGLYDLHAAGLAEPASGRGYVFPGVSGSGKTSLAVRLAASGWRYLSDDLLAVSAAGGGVEARALRRPFQISADALAGCRLPRLEEALGAAVPNDPDKRKLDPEILFPGGFARVTLPRLLCFPSVTGARESRLEAVGKAEAMARLVGMCPWSSYDVSAAREHLALLARFVGQCETYTLEAGRDIFDDPAGAARLLSRLAA